MVTNGAEPTHWQPSPPIWVVPRTLRVGVIAAMPWQPMPPPASEPSGTQVERLCGHPEQNPGVRPAALSPLEVVTASGIVMRSGTAGPMPSAPSRSTRNGRILRAMRSASISPWPGNQKPPSASRLPSTVGALATP